jgi:hypothetical protein
MYADNEGHVIHYRIRVSAAEDTLEFLSEAQAGSPRYRLLYIRTGDTTADVCFDMAMPTAPDVFKRYLSGGTAKH